MAKGAMPRREAKKPKKAESKRPIVSVPVATGEATEVVGKNRAATAKSQRTCCAIPPGDFSVPPEPHIW